MRTFRMVVAFIALASLGCEDRKQSELRVNNVVRVFMHEPQRYTLFAQPPESKELIVHEFTIYDFTYTDSHGKVLARCDIHLRTDVSAGEPMWATSERWGDHPPGNDCILTIHLHDPSDVEGGSWTQRRNKRTVHGTTHAIE